MIEQASTDTQPASRAQKATSRALPPIPSLALIFRAFAVIEFTAAIGLCFISWPQRQQSPLVEYVPAMSWLAGGIVSGYLFLGVADILIYLSDISNSLRRFGR